MERKENKKRENERRRHEEEIILMEKQAQMQWEIDKTKRREEMKKAILKKIREEKIREVWRDKEEMRKEMHDRLRGEKELFELEMKLKIDQEMLEAKVNEDQIRKKSIYHMEQEQAKKDQLEYDYQLELLKRKIGGVFISSPSAGVKESLRIAGPPFSPRATSIHSPAGRNRPGSSFSLSAIASPRKGQFSSLYKLPSSNHR
jgi:hypothetical protein